MSQRSSSLGISNPPLNGCGSGTQMRLESPGETLKVHEPETYLHSKLLTSIWPSPSRFGHRHRDRWGPMKTALLHWEDAVLISERLVTNDSWFSCLSAIVYTCPPKWSTLPSSWVTRSLSFSLATAAADSAPLLSSSLDMVQQEEN